MSSLRYRGAGLTAAQLAELGKVLIDSGDTTADFLSPKLLVTSNLTKTVQNVGGDENLLLDVPKLGKVLIDAADTTLDFLSPKLLVTSNLTKTVQNVGGDENLLLDVNLTSLDGRYVKRSPSGETQTIQPLTDNVPLTIKSFAGGTSDLLDLVNSAGTKASFFDKNGNLNLVLGGEILWASLPAVLDLALSRESGGILLVSIPAGAPANTLAQLALLGNEASAAERRVRENAGLVEITDTTPTVLTQVSPFFKVIRSAATDLALQSLIGATANFHMTADGTMIWDQSANGLQILPSGTIQWITNVNAKVFSDAISTVKVTGDLVSSNAASFNLGAPSSFWKTLFTNIAIIGVANDTQLERPGAGIIRIDIPAGGPANTLAQLALLGNEASAAERRLRENAGALEITDTTPTVLRSIVTRGAPNVTVAHNAVSVAVSFSTSEPDTNYEITIVPAYNTTVWYTLKATTGFTANFGTAGPVGGSTFDWHIERIPRT